jgi:hypothetical protein
MTRVIPVIPATLAAIISAAAVVDAHRLDELLQAARVAISPTSVVVHLDLTPGVALAPEVIARVDGDGDGRVSPLEAEAYARAVMRDLDARLDGIQLPLSLKRVEVPTTEEMLGGVGTVRLELAGETGRTAPGHHVFELRNLHQPEASAYLANALLPDSADVTILRQERDPTQQQFCLHFEMHARDDASAALWLLGGSAVLLTHARWRVGWRRRPREERDSAGPVSTPARNPHA